MSLVSLSSSESIPILQQSEMQQLISDMVDALYIQHGEGNTFDVVGIEQGGGRLAEVIVELFAERYHHKPKLGKIDITLYRDDLYTGLEKPALGLTSVPFSIDGRTIVLIDDVLFTGRTVRAALQELSDLGRPACVKLLVMIDRGHRELPIHADVVGKKLETSKGDQVQILLSNPICGSDGVILIPESG